MSDEQSKTALKHVTMYEITSKLFFHLCLSLESSFHQKGKSVIEEGVCDFQSDLMSTLLQTDKNKIDFQTDTLLDSEKVKQSFKKYVEICKKNEQDPINMYSLMAKMFAHIAKHAKNNLGEPGQDAIIEGVRTFGEERGKNIAKRAELAGKPNEKDHYLTNYDMGRSELFEFETLFHKNEIEQTFTKCAFADQWKEDGMEEHGILYCHMIDPAVAKGFNPNFEVIHDEYILKEGVCHFRFQMKEDKK
ncbi:L-2-amino-thiazoline-4-carboxylic acid hydrolase [Bacillus shivajii]|uniref:L-2-amino-thiazoline-4-carboxylic acid hydrolase n=1 Tax=Bacillus shivajii TaxID=1983719 RepID=UPI001CFB416F|nr:L-2-amino-thiazoline-4-carboxylic acid hydrolase [Bacillus shivajii]UCZ55175.1 L-2-amino-thiazoline-4-carboxylic acid hydrolase [Bacillus shivajii]